MKRYYNIAGFPIAISGKEEEMYLDERRLKDFRTVKEEQSYCYNFMVVDMLEVPQGIPVYKDVSEEFYRAEKQMIRYIGFLGKGIKGAYLRIVYSEKEAQVQVRRDKIYNRISCKIVLNCLGMETLALKAGGFVLHSSFIEVNGKAILFTGPSGTGKSTQAELWKTLRGADIINGDRAVVRIKNGMIDACGLPFAGSSEYCKNISLPLAAIVYLGQAEETNIRPLHGAEAFRRLWEQITVPVWDKNAVEQVSEALMILIKSVPIYHLVCTPDESAVLAFEKALGNTTFAENIMED